MSTTSSGSCRQEEETGKESEAMECVDSSEKRAESEAGVKRADWGTMLVKGEAEGDKDVASEGAVGTTKDEDTDVTPHSEETEGDLLPLYLLYYIIYKYTENGTNGKRQLPFVRCKRKTEVCFP
jgi:hypothetical protein